jgi:hypothetical protein
MATYMRKVVRKKRSLPERYKVRKTELQSLWESRISEAEMIKDRWKDQFKVDVLEKLYEGSEEAHKPDYWTNEDWFTLNLVFQSIKILKRNICPKGLIVNMRLARSFIADPGAIMKMEQLILYRKAVLQYLITHLKLFAEGRLAYLNALWQFGVLKIGYSAEIEDNINAGAILMNKEGKIVYDPESGMPLVEDPYDVISEEFFIDQVDPECFLVDRYCQNSIDKTGTWVAHKIFKPLKDLLEDSLYDWKAVKDLGPSTLEQAEKLYLQREEQYLSPHTWSPGADLPENEIVVLYEIYDLKEKKVLTIARGAEDVLRKPQELPPGIALHPFVILKFNERRGTFYPIPELFNWVGPQVEYNITRNQMALHRKRFNRKYLYDANKVDPSEAEKLVTGEDGALIKVSGAGAIDPLKDAPVDQALVIDTKVLREEFKEQTGIGQLQRGQTGAESATEAEIVERRAREAEIDEHEIMLDFLSGASKKLHDTMESNLTQEGAVEMIGPYGRGFVPYGPEFFETIAGEILMEVTVDPIERQTLQVERAQLMQVIDLIAKSPWIAMDPVILRAVFNKFPALMNNEALYQSIARLAQMMIGMEQQAAQAKSGGQIPGGSTGDIASSSRPVVSR